MRQASSTLKPQRLTGQPRPCRRIYHATLLAVCCDFLAGTVLGMGIEKEAQVIARSTDGKSALHEEYDRGPEGGGRAIYRITGPAGETSFMVSSDLSHGGGSRPQLVSEAECVRRLSELSGQLTASGFSGVTVHPERCRKKWRDRLVTVSKKR